MEYIQEIIGLVIFLAIVYAVTPYGRKKIVQKFRDLVGKEENNDKKTQSGGERPYRNKNINR